MSLRPRRRNLVVWSSCLNPADGYGAPFTRLARTRRIRRCIRTAALLTVIGLMRPARTVRTRWRAQQRRSELERELAAYSTAAQRRDLEATLDRYPDDITYELRDILASQAMAASHPVPSWLTCASSAR
jgi:hypothetical protein